MSMMWIGIGGLALSAGSTGLSYYQGEQAKKAAKSGQRNYADELAAALSGQKGISKDLYNLERKYQPKYAQLAADTYAQILPGLQATANRQTRQATGNDIQNLRRFGSKFTTAYLGATPEVQRLLGGLTSAAESDLALGSELSPEEERAGQQAARAAYAARGTGLSDQSNLAEILNNYQLRNLRRDQRRGFAGGVMQAAQAAYAPAMSQFWANKLDPSTLALQMQQTAGAKIFNPESNYAGGIQNQNYQSQLLAQAAAARNMQAAAQGSMSMFGDLASGYLQYQGAQGAGAAKPAAPATAAAPVG